MPKENKSTVVEMERRIRSVQEWIINDYAYVDIVKQSMQNWGISDRQAKNYIKTAGERFAEANKQDVELLRAAAIERRKKLARDLKESYKGTPGGIGTLLDIEKDICKLQGLYIDKVSLTDPTGKPLQMPNTTVVINTQSGTIEYPAS